MDFIKTPVKGMPEQLPQDMILREFVLNKIKVNYGKYGFLLIETPAVEHIENLTNKQGGENEQLIFKILKRGEKLKKETTLDNISDSGLRYDLTVPLARFYANNAQHLPMPFKAFQIGNVWRADNPQKGRLRQFMQCDIDIIGDRTKIAEIDLITATVDMLSELGLGKCTVRVNDRRILKQMALNCNFNPEQLSPIFVILDKYDKIGVEGVKNKLMSLGMSENNVDKYCGYLKTYDKTLSCKDFFAKEDNSMDAQIVENLEDIINITKNLVKDKGNVIFDPTLVRGMGYYTGPIFEIELNSYHLSIAGGGRYDKMIGKYMGHDVPACGFSIGLERIMSIIKEKQKALGLEGAGVSYLVDKDTKREKIEEIFNQAAKLRENDTRVSVSTKIKNIGRQREELKKQGYGKIIDTYEWER